MGTKRIQPDHQLNNIRRAYMDMPRHVCDIAGLICCSTCRLPVTQCICEPACLHAMAMGEQSNTALAERLFDLYASGQSGLTPTDEYVLLLASARLRCCAELHGGC